MTYSRPTSISRSLIARSAMRARYSRRTTTHSRPGTSVPGLGLECSEKALGAATVFIRVIAVLAAAITFYQLTRPGFLFGITPDIAAWLGGSVRLVHGSMPYRDFDLVQPPGFPLLVSPLAFLSEWIGTRDALAILRLCTPVLAAASVLLIGKVVRPHGRIAVIVACGVMALYPAQLYALRSGLLESVVVFFCLAGAALVFDGDSFAVSRRRILVGGILFGIAGTVKAPAIVPVLVLFVLCLSDIRRRLLPFVTGVVAGFGIPTLPFFVLAPGSFVRDVLITPLSSIPAGNRVSIPVRLGDITGTSAFGGSSASIIATVVIVAIVVSAFVRRGAGHRPWSGSRSPRRSCQRSLNSVPATTLQTTLRSSPRSWGCCWGSPSHASSTNERRDWP